MKLLENLRRQETPYRVTTVLQAEIDVEAIGAIETLTAATNRASRITVILNTILVALGVAGTVLGSLALAR